MLLVLDQARSSPTTGESGVRLVEVPVVVVRGDQFNRSSTVLPHGDAQALGDYKPFAPSAGGS